MDPARSTAPTGALDARLSYRAAIAAASASLALVVAATTRVRSSAAAQEAPPNANDAGDSAFLFVQTFAGGALRPNPAAGTPAAGGSPTPGGGASYLLELAGHHGETVYFSDRPRRVFGEAPTQAFLDGLGFSPGNPPNAALVAQTEGGDAVVVLELLDPAYDAGAGTVRYGAEILAGYAGEGLAHVAEQQLDEALPEAFGRASLFIDGCEDRDSCTRCGLPPRCYSVGSIPGGPYGYCWSWDPIGCYPCRDYGDLAWLCNATYPDRCEGQCGPTA